MSVSKRVMVTLITVGVILALPVGLWLADSLTPSVVRRALPASATDIQEYYKDDYFHGDFLRCLRARMPESEMPRLAAELGLTQRYDPKRDAKLPLNFSVDSGVSWWHQPTTMRGAYFKYTPGEERFSAAFYQNGCVYFLATAW